MTDTTAATVARIAELRQRALAAQRAGQFIEAEAAYSEIVAAVPADAKAWHSLGIIALHAGRSDLAADRLRRAIGIDARNPEYFANLGVALCGLARPSEAIESFRTAISLRPDYAPAYSNLGNALCTLGRYAEAEASYRGALRLRSDYAEAHNNLGGALRSQGRLAQAEASFRAALRLRPTYADASSNLAAVVRDLGRHAEAEAVCREALYLQPEVAQLHAALGLTLYGVGRLTDAEASCREAVRLRPTYAEAYNTLGLILQELGRPAEAAASYRRALQLRPNYPEAHNNFGNTARQLGLLDEAEVSYREALRLRPEIAEVHNNLGNLLCDLGDLPGAEAHYCEAIRLRPVYAEAHTSLGVVQRHMARLPEAEASHRHAIRLRPDLADAHNNLAYVLLTAGRYDEGWREYEWRWRTKHLAPGVREFAAPVWTGEAIGDRVLLVHAEQGLGDTLQFCRYVPLVPGDRIVLEVQPSLLRLLSRLPGVGAIVAQGEPLPRFDLHCPMLSLPGALGTALETIPATVPYLAADPARVRMWRDRLKGMDGLRVGLAWAGGRRANVAPELVTADRRRSIALKSLAPFGETAGVMFVSLQKGDAAKQSADPPPGMALYDFTAELTDFAETAALVEALDLVISVDTAVAHLAGALGKRVWLLNRFDTDWRWLLDRDDSPWYPTLRQFRQPTFGDWDGAVAAAHQALRRLAAEHRSRSWPRPREAGEA